MKRWIKKYLDVAEAYGPSGREDAVREKIRELAEPFVDEIHVDTLGNLICHKKGKGKKILFAAHMDSLGFAVTHVDENGFLRFAPVGGIFWGDLINTPVRFENGTRGVISYEEKTPFKNLTMDQLFLDIGAASKKEVEGKVRIGDFAVYAGATYEQSGILCGPYLDNRIGCMTLLLAMEQITQTENDLSFVFTVQEEVGLRGAGAAAFALEPDIALAVDVTDTGDLPERKTPMAVQMGKGPALKVMDRSVICAPAVNRWLQDTAVQHNISLQNEIMPFGGTDTAALQKSRGGILVGAVSIPTRYIHSPCEMCTVEDVEKAARLLARAAEKKL